MLRVGVIGVGAMGQNHARVYSELPETELVGVTDVDYGLAKTLAERYHTTPFSDYQSLLQQGIDAVSIAVPTTLHKEVAVNVAQRGVNILIEKPIAHNTAAASEIIETAQKNNVKLMVGHVERFNPVVPIIKKQIEDTEISLIEITRIGPFPPRIKDVGVVIDLATHDIDLIRYLTGSEFKKVYSLTSKNVAQYEDVAIMLFEMETGTLARVTVNWLTPYKIREISIATKERFIKALLIDQKVTVYNRNNGYAYCAATEIIVPAGEPLKLELQAFLDCIRNNTRPPISGEDGLKALKVATQVNYAFREAIKEDNLKALEIAGRR